MKSVIKTLALLLLLSACSSDKNPSGSGSPSSENNPKNALAEKIANEYPGMLRNQALCTVEKAMKDGGYSLEDINKLGFDTSSLIHNDQDVYKAFSDALSFCTKKQ